MSATNMINIPPTVEEFCGNQAKWNTNEELARILYSAQNHPEWITNDMRPFPPSTSQKLYKRLDGAYFKQDGYEWKKRKEGKLIREDHVKLKVQKMDTVYGSYVHSAIVPSFHRRTYWLCERPDIVLVHYLNVTAEEMREGQPLRVRIAQSIIASGLDLTQAQIEQQIKPIFNCSMRPSDLESLLSNVFQLLNAYRNIHMSDIVSDRSDCDRAENGIAELNDAVLERSNNSGDGASRSSYQPSFSNDNVDWKHLETAACLRCQNSSAGPFMSSGSETVWTKSSISIADNQSISASPRLPICAAQENDHRFGEDGSDLVNIIDFSPDRSPTMGGTKVLLVGGWYLREYNYAVMFDDRQVPATLFHAGVLRCIAPPHSAGSVKLRIFCNGSLISKSAQFVYFDPGTREERDLMMHELSQRLAYLLSCLNLNAESYVPELPNEFTEEAVVNVLNEMMRYAFNHTLLSARTRLTETRSLLHICASLDYYRAVKIILQWRSRIPSHYYIRDFDVLARDSDGRTPLHYAVLHESIYSIEILIPCCRNSLDIVDDRGETPKDLAARSGNSGIANAIARSTDLLVVPQGKPLPAIDVTSPTAVWVLTDGRAMTVEQSGTNAGHSVTLQDNSVSNLSESALDSFLDEDCSEIDTASSDSGAQDASDRDSWIDEPLSMEVSIPDSPTSAGMWKALASVDERTDEVVRERMASLAQQIIDALPERIKKNEENMEPSCIDEVVSFSELSSSGLSVHSKNPFLPSACFNTSSDWEELISPLHPSPYEISMPVEMTACIESSATTEVGPLDVLSGNHPSFLPHSQCVNPESTSNGAQPAKKTSKDMGEFFNSGAAVGPIERYFRNLRLTDREQRELYEAAKIIQQAYRQYKARITTQRQNEAERNAAVVIQSYYRRYKQYCYFKKLHKAAVLIQKHYRMHKALQKQKNAVESKCGSNLQHEDAHPNIVPLLKEHQAAVTIQNAYRGHYQRKRQAAARKIQKFMRQSKQKLRKVPELSGGVSNAATPLTVPAHGTSSDRKVATSF